MNRSLTTLILLCLALMAGCSTEGKPVYESAPLSNGAVRIDAASLKEDVPMFFSMPEAGGRRVDFFVLRHKDEVSAFFDACRKCYPKKLGYRFVNGQMVCAACGETYGIWEIKGTGSCHPIQLEGRIENGHFVIDAADISAGVKYF